MALIDPNHPALQGDENQFWKDEYDNSRILLYELNKAIKALMEGGIKQYSLNTGQDSMTVTRQDLPQLLERREKLLNLIVDYENKLGINQKTEQSLFQVVPEW